MASIRKRTGKNGISYQITVSNGYKAGKKSFETATWHPDPARTDKQNQKDLQQFAADFERKVQSGKYLDGEKITFSEFTDQWLKDYAEANLEPTSLANARRLLQLHVIPEIGHLKLAKVQPQHISRMYSKMAEKRKDGKPGGYASATIQRVHSAVSSVFARAVLWNVITDNPASRVELPAQDKAIDTDEYFTPEQANLFLDLLDKEFSYHVSGDNHKTEYTRSGSVALQLKLFFYIAVFCGCRRGEIVALLWSDIDFEKCQIHITKNTTLADGKPVHGKPKKNSSRTITADPIVIELAKKWQREQKIYRWSIGDQWIGTEDYVFITWNGLQMRPETPYKSFKRIIDRYNKSCPDDAQKLPDIALHGLRHTNATLQISEQVDPETVAHRLGHKKTSTTLDIYAHALEAKDQGAAAAVSSALGRKMA